MANFLKALSAKDWMLGTTSISTLGAAGAAAGNTSGGISSSAEVKAPLDDAELKKTQIYKENMVYQKLLGYAVHHIEQIEKGTDNEYKDAKTRAKSTADAIKQQSKAHKVIYDSTSFKLEL